MCVTARVCVVSLRKSMNIQAIHIYTPTFVLLSPHTHFPQIADCSFNNFFDCRGVWIQLCLTEIFTRIMIMHTSPVDYTPLLNGVHNIPTAYWFEPCVHYSIDKNMTGSEVE